MKEKLRHKLSAFLHSKKASEENPFNCHILLDSETMGTLQIPTITEMFEDNEGQCVDKFNIAKQYFENMSNDNQNEFMNSEDYVIKCAKERLLSWANYLDQEIIYINGEYVFDANKVMSLTKNNISSSDELLIIAILFISLTNLIGVIYINKKRTNK